MYPHVLGRPLIGSLPPDLVDCGAACQPGQPLPEVFLGALSESVESLERSQKGVLDSILHVFAPGR